MLRYSLFTTCAIGVLAGWGGAAWAQVGAMAEEFVYRSPTGIVFTVRPQGLSSIAVGDRVIASGAWGMFVGDGWFKDFKDGPMVTLAKEAKRSLVRIDERTVRVTHEMGEVNCIFTYRFEGEDVTIAARVENLHGERVLHMPTFGGLTFTFDAVPQGLMPVQHVSYFQAHGIGLCHPGFWSKIGGTWAADSGIGVGTSPVNTGLARTLTLWDYASWDPAKREKDPRRRLMYFAHQEVPPLGAATVAFRIRVSTNRDWKHLLEPYREHFQRTFGAVQYKADSRWIATDYLNHSQKVVGPTNPYGFHGGHRRIDTEEGARKFCDLVIPMLRDNGGQGIIVWGQGGDDPRGGMYRPDFDVLPPEVEAQWEGIMKRFAEAKVKFGVCTRPRDMAVKLNWKQDQIISINPDDPGHRQMLWRRFENMMKRGSTLFYLDSFGASFEDVKLMRFLRQKMGPEVLTFAEHQCDAIMPYSGGYSETSYSAAEGEKPARYRLWSGVDQWEVYQWLVPGAQMAARLYEVKGKLPEGMVGGPDEWFAAHRITTLLPVNDSKRAAVLKALGERR